MDRDSVVDYLSALDDGEFAALAAEARRPQDRDVKSLILRELTRTDTETN